MMRLQLVLLICVVLVSCSISQARSESVLVLPYLEDPPEQCVPIFAVSGTGADQDEAVADLLRIVAEAGGNAVARVGAIRSTDPETGNLVSFTERGLAYVCARNVPKQ